MSDAAQKAVEEQIAREVYRRLYPGHIGTHDSQRTPESDLAENDRAYDVWDAGREGFAPGRICREVAAHVLAVLSETHAVVKLPEDDDGYEYGILRDELVGRYPDMAYCNGVLDQGIARLVASRHPEVTLVRRVYGPWTPVAVGRAR